MLPVSLCLVSLAIGWLNVPAAAQISPGPLSRAHQGLEGSRHCLDCHRAGQGVDANLCLSCHGALAARVAAGQGLHARPDYARCERCHAEHHGRDFALVYWGEGGESTFDHRQAGLELAGAHQRLACGDCHRPDRIDPNLRETTAGVAIEHTFLGLDATCAACHRDPHAGKLGSSCAGCHDQTAWKPAAGFDHDTTRFRLSGRHRAAPCIGCHLQSGPESLASDPSSAAPSAATLGRAPISSAASTTAGFVEFRDRALPSCASCHRDPHDSRLGTSCGECHDTTSFSRADRTRFDHQRTKYSLIGKHRSVACEGCHQTGKGYRLANFDRCESCHRDPHAGHLVDTRGSGNGVGCASCHSPTGFLPALFGPEEHAQGKFALRDAHLAVPCVSCHREVEVSQLPAARSAPQGPQLARPPTVSTGRSGSAGKIRQFHFAATSCRDCHRDPHAGKLDRYARTEGCATCHRETSFREVAFDHETSAFPLRGRHQAVACSGCHQRNATAVVGANGEVAAGGLELSGLPTTCAGCHADPHRGQLAVAGAGAEPRERGQEREAFSPAVGVISPATACERCHGVDHFVPAQFDHQRDAAWVLDGAHLQVPCVSCHPVESDELGSFIRYRPVPTACAGCHSNLSDTAAPSSFVLSGAVPSHSR